MSKVKEIIVEAVLPVIKEIGKLEMEAVLISTKDHQTPEAYEKTLQSLYSSFSLIEEGALKSKTKIDDGIIDIILEAVKSTAAKAGIVLS